MIEIIGAGVVGQAFGQSLIAKGYGVSFVDCCPVRVDALQRAGHEARLPDGPRSNARFHFLCVPTPTVDDCQDLAALNDALHSLGRRLQPGEGATIAIRSTILPGTSRQLAVPVLEQASGLSQGKDFHVVFFPEFLREKQATADASAPRLHVLGEIEAGGADALAELLRAFHAPIMRLSAEAAELQKYVHNCYNAAKISYFNDLRRIATHLGVHNEVEAIFGATRITAEALWNPAYGTKNLGPFAGSCLPKDLIALVQWLQARGESSPLLKSVWESNTALVQSASPAEA